MKCHYGYFVVGLILVAGLSGCADKSVLAPVKPPVSSSPKPAIGNQAETGTGPAKAEVDALKLKADETESKASKSPNNASLQLSAANADYAAGHAMMTSPELDRKVKYRMALQYFRKSLKLNPKHKEAAEEKDLIESIYRQMGRPIPE